MELLKTVRLRKHFGNVQAVHNVDITLNPGELTAIIGPNGAGKTTLINLLTGKLFPDAGQIFFQGEEITTLPVHQRVKKGMGRSFQITNILPSLSVAANLTIPVLALLGKSLQLLSNLRKMDSVTVRVEEILEDIGLLDKKELPAEALSHGDQRLLEIGMALATRPHLLILDEPTAGMNPVERTSILEHIRHLAREKQVTFLIVEHDMDVVFSLSERIIVMHRGQVIADGAPDRIRENPEVREIYLGEELVGKKRASTWSEKTSEITPEMLVVEQINTFYGTSHILQDLSLTVQAGEVVCLLGRNGVGKTTTLRSIMGLTPPHSGSIRFQGTEITGNPPYTIARRGVGYVPDDRRIFPDLTVRENLEIARWAMPKQDGDWTVEKVLDFFPALRSLETRKGRYLSGGEQKMLAIGRALMENPLLLLLDEPSEGLSPLIVQMLAETLLRIQESGVTILMADQNLKFAQVVANRAYILEKGIIQYEGTIEELWKNEVMVKKYLAL